MGAVTFCIFGPKPASARPKDKKEETKSVDEPKEAKKDEPTKEIESAKDDKPAKGKEEADEDEHEGAEKEDALDAETPDEEEEEMEEIEDPPTRSLWGQLYDMIDVEVKELAAEKKKKLAELVKKFM